MVGTYPAQLCPTEGPLLLSKNLSREPGPESASAMGPSSRGPVLLGGSRTASAGGCAYRTAPQGPVPWPAVGQLSLRSKTTTPNTVNRETAESSGVAGWLQGLRTGEESTTEMPRDRQLDPSTGPEAGRGANNCTAVSRRARVHGKVRTPNGKAGVMAPRLHLQWCPWPSYISSSADSK